MTLRLKYATAFMGLVFMIAFGGCTDTPSVSGGDNGNDGECDAGEVLNEITGECVPSSSQNTNNSNNDPNGGNFNNQDPGELDPWDDESGDGIPNQYDNCPFHENPDQLDSDGDGVGDVCDNCPGVANPDQAASPDNPVDDRGIIMGDACTPGGDDNPYADLETDSSGDGVPNIMDNCPDHYNPPVMSSCGCPPNDPYCDECLCTCPNNEYPCSDCAQIDSSGDGIGDKCDNCPHHFNPNQTSSPGNDVDDRGITMGDACNPVPNNIPICGTQDTEFELLDPNVYVAFDISGSMGTSGMSQAKIGLDAMAESLHNQMRFGFGTYPAPGASGGAGCNIAHLHDMGNYSENQLKNMWGSLGHTGCTPMLDTMLDIYNNDRLTDPSDPNDHLRAKAVILITDGLPNCAPNTGTCGHQTDQVNNVANVISNLYADDVLTFSVGFQIDDSSLVTFAQAGGTGQPLLASDGAGLAQALAEVAELLVSCEYTLDPAPEDGNKIWVNVDGDYLDTGDYSYDSGSNVLSLSPSACDTVRSFDDDFLQLEISMGCATDCQEEEPEGYCDLYYETCGAGYDCEECSPEICDGTDNNCSGIVDENCPECGIYQTACESSSDCCEPFVCSEDGICDHACYPLGTTCRSSSDCCDGVCAISSGNEVGQCITG